MKIYPKLYFEKITDITIEILNKNNIKGLILDVDNTLIDYDKNTIPGVKDWMTNLKNHGIKSIILSNTNKKDKVEKVAKELDLPYIYLATKPFKRGFNQAKEYLKLESHEIAAIGDQIFTDVVGANRSKMFSILVKPVDKRDILITKWKRPIEELIVKRYINKQNRDN